MSEPVVLAVSPLVPAMLGTGTFALLALVMAVMLRGYRATCFLLFLAAATLVVTEWFLAFGDPVRAIGVSLIAISFLFMSGLALGRDDPDRG